MKYFNRNPQKMKTIFLKITFLLYIGLLINCTSSNDPEDELPAITQTGANTFGAIVEGNVFVPKDKTGYYAPGGGRPRGLNISSGDGIVTKNYYAISTANYINIYIYLYIPEDRPEQKEYTFKSSPGVGSGLDTPNFPHVFCYINDRKYISYENSGTINFQKIDFNQEVCAGVFSGKLKNENNPTDIIEITEGRFDLICTAPLGD